MISLSQLSIGSKWTRWELFSIVNVAHGQSKTVIFTEIYKLVFLLAHNFETNCALS